MINRQIPWGFKHRPGGPGEYGISIRFYLAGKWHSRNLGRFAKFSDALHAGDIEAKRRGFIRTKGAL